MPSAPRSSMPRRQPADRSPPSPRWPGAQGCSPGAAWSLRSVCHTSTPGGSRERPSPAPLGPRGPSVKANLLLLGRTGRAQVGLCLASVLLTEHVRALPDPPMAAPLLEPLRAPIRAKERDPRRGSLPRFRRVGYRPAPPRCWCVLASFWSALMRRAKRLADSSSLPRRRLRH